MFAKPWTRSPPVTEEGSSTSTVASTSTKQTTETIAVVAGGGASASTSKSGLLGWVREISSQRRDFMPRYVSDADVDECTSLFDCVEEMERGDDGWHLILEANGNRIWRRYNEEGIGMYRAYGRIGHSAHRYWQAMSSADFYLDTQKTCAHLEFLNGTKGQCESGEEIVYQETKYPWPLVNRDYVCARRSAVYHNKNNDSPPVYVYLCRAIKPEEDRSLPAETANRVRVLDYRSRMATRDVGPGECEFISEVFDDARCSSTTRATANLFAAKILKDGFTENARSLSLYQSWASQYMDKSSPEY